MPQPEEPKDAEAQQPAQSFADSQPEHLPPELPQQVLEADGLAVMQPSAHVVQDSAGQVTDDRAASAAVAAPQAADSGPASPAAAAVAEAADGLPASAAAADPEAAVSRSVVDAAADAAQANGFANDGSHGPNSGPSGAPLAEGNHAAGDFHQRLMGHHPSKRQQCPELTLAAQRQVRVASEVCFPHDAKCNHWSAVV